MPERLRGGGGGFAMFPDGEYPIRCHKIKKTTSRVGNPMYVLECDVINGNRAHRCKEHLVLIPSCTFILERTLQAWGVTFTKELFEKKLNEQTGKLDEIFDFEFEPQDFVGKAVRADVEVVTKPAPDDPEKIIRWYQITNIWEAIAPDPNWPTSPWLEKKEGKPSSAGMGSEPKVTTGSGMDDDDLPF